MDFLFINIISKCYILLSKLILLILETVAKLDFFYIMNAKESA